MWWSPFWYYRKHGWDSGHYILDTALKHYNVSSIFHLKHDRIGFMVPSDYCHTFVKAVERNRSENVSKSLASGTGWASQYKNYASDYFHLLCIQEYAYRPMRPYSESMSMPIF